MKKMVWIVGFSLALFGMNSVAAGNNTIIPIISMLLLSATDAPNECGDARSPLVGKNYSGEIEVAGDVDFLKIVIPNFYTELQLKFAADIDIDARLHDARCNSLVVGFNTNFPINPDFRFARNLAPGIYYLKISTYELAAKQTGNYSLTSKALENYVYLSAQYGDAAAVELGTNNDTPYSPEYPDAAYFVNKGPNSNPLIYDSVEESYYRTVDPFGQRETVKEWKLKNGFIDFNGNERSGVIHAEYVNAYDLGIGRKMSCMNKAPAYPCILENYFVGPKFNRNPELFAYVAMERVDNKQHTGLTGRYDDRYYTAFYAYDSAGNRVNSVDLDGSGAKKLPEVCWACHDGSRRERTFFGGGGLGSRAGQYLPFDMALYRRFPGSSKTIASQESNFRQLNKVIGGIYDQDQTIPASSHGFGHQQYLHGQINKLIDHWSVNGLTSDHEDGFKRRFKILQGTSYVDHPGGVIGHYTNSAKDGVIRDFYGKYCRTCHISQPAGDEMDCTVCHGEGGSSASFKVPRRGINIDGVACSTCHADRAPTLLNLNKTLCENTDPEASQMPNAKMMHLRFIEENRSVLFPGIPENPFNPPLLRKLLNNISTANLCNGGTTFAKEIYPRN